MEKFTTTLLLNVTLEEENQREAVNAAFALVEELSNTHDNAKVEVISVGRGEDVVVHPNKVIMKNIRSSDAGIFLRFLQTLFLVRRR